MKAVVLNITSPQSLPVGESRPLTGESATISSVGAVVTASIASFGKADEGKYIYAGNQLRTITGIRGSLIANIATAFDTDLTNEAFTVVTAQKFTDLMILGNDAFSIGTPNAPLAVGLIFKTRLKFSETTGAFSFVPGTSVTVSYLAD